MKTLQTAYMESPIGRIELKASSAYLCSMRLVPPTGEEEEPPASNPILQEAIRQLTEYFAGQRRNFDLPILQEGTPFQQKVWNELQKIPYGDRISYKELAAKTGNSRACRAVGSANGKNHLFIIVPCHRVVRSGGGLGGFAYGLDIKEFLLELEQKNLGSYPVWWSGGVGKDKGAARKQEAERPVTDEPERTGGKLSH
ncbi:MAG: methylated-DNA--[protein]-cysteine S-methyltransferase [Tannerellaceae bacterium]|jgi:methylated-DNA-[protein]-cysteine S-methyltransferase|nr:methylated-DNA--[protein]-cysteine S-methyltransferase [Tannerellaceae bacterium]